MLRICSALRPLVLLTALALPAAKLSAADQPPTTWRDNFATAAAGSDGAPAWDPESADWEVQAGGYLGQSGMSFWQAVPLGADVTFACDVTVLEQLRGDWLTAGIGLGTDEKNLWAVNLVVTPEKQGRRHTSEMHESLAGHWLAESDPGSRLKHQGDKGGPVDWQLNQTYRLEMRLTAEEVVGRISAGDRELARYGLKFDATTPAVRAGRPLLRVAGLRVRFSNATVSVARTAPESPATKPSFPAWVSRPGAAVGPGSGFFRTALVENGCELPPSAAAQSAAHPAAQWWLVDPEGKPFFDVGTDHVNYRAHWCEALGYAPYHRHVEKKFGSEEAWAASALERLRAWGFNTLPAGHSPILRHHGLPHILFASFGTSFAKREWICEPIHWTGFPDVFSPRWETHCRFVARRMARESVGDPWCLGTFLDNELEWYGKKGHLVDEVFQLGPQRPAKRALVDWLLKRFGNLAEINRQLGTQHADEAALLAATTVPSSSAGLDAVRDGFLAEIAERYFAVAAGAMRAADPQHLVLGCRFAGRTPPPALAAAGKYNDVFTFNTYPRVDFQDAWRADGVGGVVQRVPRELLEMYQVVRRPMIITEWSFPALDSGLPCKHGAGMRVDTQEQKAACYRIFAQAMTDLPFMVGYHYFMWADEPAPGISSTFPEDSNYGLVNEKDETYTVLVQTATEVNQAAAARHAASLFSGELLLRTAGAAAEVVNPGDVPARGMLRVVGDGRTRIEEVRLPPRGTRRVDVGTNGAWFAELQQWDGTKVRCLGGRRLGPLEVANASATPLENVPVVIDGPPVAAGFLRRLAPGQTAQLAVADRPPTDAERLELKADTVTWRAARRDGSLFETIQAGDLPLGRLLFATHQRLDGHSYWTDANRVTALKAQELADAWIVEATLERAGGAARGAAQFRAAVRAVVFKSGGVALVKPLWIENTDARPWELAAAFWFCRSAIGGSAADDQVGSRDVPNYYRAAQFITDQKLGGCFGAMGQPGGWQVSFWHDTGAGRAIHPDCYYKLDQRLEPGQRWMADRIPYLWIFAAGQADAWRDVAQRHRQAEDLLLGGR